MARINAALLPAKLHYFAFFASQGGILPFCVTIAAQFGVSPALLGIIFLTLPLLAVIAKPGFGFLADKLQGTKAIFLCCVLLMTAAFSSICFIPPVEVVPRTTSLWCLEEVPSLETCNLQQPRGSSTILCNASCDLPWPNPIFDQLCKHHSPSYCTAQNATERTMALKAEANTSGSEEDCIRHTAKVFAMADEGLLVPVCLNMSSDQCSISCQGSEDPELGSYHVTPQTIYFWILMIIAYIFMHTGTSLGDTIVLSMIPSYEAFGRQRLYGSIGFGLMSIVSGQLVDTFSDGPGSSLNFVPAYSVVLIFGLLDFIISSFLNEKKVEKPKHLFKNVGRVFLNPETLLLTSAVFSVGFFSGILWTYLIVYLVDLGASQLLIGLTMGMQCFLGEIPFMFISAWFLKKIGHGHSMTLVLAVFGIRFLLYHLIDDPWFVLPIEVTQGICFGIFFTALATYASIIAPPSSHATMQGTLQAVFEGIGGGLGSFVGGLVYEATSGKTMWLIMGVVSCLCAILHALVLFIINRRKNKQQSGPQEDLVNGKEESKEVDILLMTTDQSTKLPDKTEAVVDLPEETILPNC